MSDVEFLSEQLYRLRSLDSLAAINFAQRHAVVHGDAHGLHAVAAELRTLADTMDRTVHLELRRVHDRLKHSWHEKAAHLAVEKLSKEAQGIDEFIRDLRGFATILEHLSMEVDIAHKEDAEGFDYLHRAAPFTIAPGETPAPTPARAKQAKELGVVGIGWRLAAAARSTDNSAKAAHDIHELGPKPHHPSR